MQSQAYSLTVILHVIPLQGLYKLKKNKGQNLSV